MPTTNVKRKGKKHQDEEDSFWWWEDQPYRFGKSVNRPLGWITTQVKDDEPEKEAQPQQIGYSFHPFSLHM